MSTFISTFPHRHPALQACLTWGLYKIGVDFLRCASKYALALGAPPVYVAKACIQLFSNHLPVVGVAFGSLSPAEQAAATTDHNRLWAALENIAAYASLYRQHGMNPNVFTAPIGAFLDYRPLSTPSESPPSSNSVPPTMKSPTPLRTQSEEFEATMMTNASPARAESPGVKAATLATFATLASILRPSPEAAAAAVKAAAAKAEAAKAFAANRATPAYHNPEEPASPVTPSEPPRIIIKEEPMDEGPTGPINDAPRATNTTSHSAGACPSFHFLFPPSTCAPQPYPAHSATAEAARALLQALAPALIHQAPPATTAPTGVSGQPTASPTAREPKPAAATATYHHADPRDLTLRVSSVDAEIFNPWGLSSSECAKHGSPWATTKAGTPPLCHLAP